MQQTVSDRFNWLYENIANDISNALCQGGQGAHAAYQAEGFG